ncbi:SCF ubiquitin ligase complex subunit, partial [Gamsiella multidivaricata]
QLRILNLTSCSLITDETLIRIIPAAPRLRSLALTKCDKITDTGASVIKTLGKHLHYLHLGHCVKITDRLVATLAQHCTRIRYLDLACCTKLTDASLFALAQLPKLRRIGLVNAVAALVTQCSKLTHLSVTGVHAFISPNYQRFCRAPPPEFTAHQREVFCVFSGKGVRDLRSYMQENPVMLPSEASLASLRASYGRATLAADAIALDGPDHEQESSLMLHSLTAATILAQMSSGMLATDAGMITQATGDQPLETLATAAAAEVAVATEGEEGVEADGPADMEGVLEESTQGPLVFLEDSGRSSSSFPGPSSPTRFPVLQHPHHRAPHYYHSHRTDPGAVVLDGSDMEVDQAFEEDAQGTDNPGRLPSPGTLARSLNRESEGSGAGSASPAEEEEEEADDEDEEL